MSYLIGSRIVGSMKLLHSTIKQAMQNGVSCSKYLERQEHISRNAKACVKRRFVIMCSSSLMNSLGRCLLALPNTLKTACKCECECFVGIDEGVSNILRARKHLCLNDRSSLDQVVEPVHSKPMPFDHPPPDLLKSYRHSILYPPHCFPMTIVDDSASSLSTSSSLSLHFCSQLGDLVVIGALRPWLGRFFYSTFIASGQCSFSCTL